MNYRELARESVMAHEGLSLKPYLCSSGKLTIGYGRNLEENGITKEEAQFMLEHDLKHAELDARAFFTQFEELSATRKSVLIDMAYNLGFYRLHKFKRFKQALENQKYEEAAFEMLDSRWAVQVGTRANTLAEKMKRG
jgi:lysozyme